MGVAAALAAVVAVLAAMTPAGAQTANKADVIIGSGSDTTYPMLLAIDRVYNGSVGCYSEAASGQPAVRDLTCASDAGRPARPTTENQDHDLVVQRFPIGSGNGRTQLRTQGSAGVAPVQYARSSAGPGSSDAGLNFVAFAREAITWVSFPNAAGADSAGIDDLTQAQLTDIFVDCTIYDWRQLKEPGFTPPARDDAFYSDPANQPILVYTAQAGSGTRSTWDGFVGGNTETCLQSGQAGRRVIFENNAQPIVDNGETANAIFFYSTGRHSISGGQTSVLGRVDGIAATPETIRPGGAMAFPYSRNVFNVYRSDRFTGSAGPSPQEVVDYVGESGWICKPDDQHQPGVGALIDQTITDQGFVTLGLGAIGGGAQGQSKCRLTAQP